jgi:oligopeptide transport system substrate-binding protein
MGALVALTVVLAACTADPGTSEEPSGSSTPSVEPAEQVLRVDIGGEPPTLDPTAATDSASIQVLRSLTYPLAYFDEDLNIVPGLAESWDVSEDGQTITFHLKADLKYSNGDPIVASDFVYSWKRLIDPRTAAGYSYVMADVVGGAELLGADPEVDDIDAMLDAFGVAAPDESTFVVSLSHAASYFVYIATLWVTVPLQESWTSTEGFTEAENYVSSGPMKLTTWEHNAQIVLEPNENWSAGPAPTLERIELAMIADPAASLGAYETDDLDIGGVPSQDVARVQEDPELSQEVLQGAVLSIYYFGFDMKDPNGPFAQSLNLRKAFVEAIDRETMITVAFGGIGTVAYSLVPPGMPGYQETKFMEYNLEQAQADFAAGLTDLGITAADLHLQIGFNADSNHENKVEFMQGQWSSAFNVTVEPVSLEWGAYLDRLSEDPFDIFRLGWGADYPHPNNFLTDLISCSSGNNNMGYCNEEVDALLAEAAVKPTLDEQVPLYNQAQEQVMADAPVITIRNGARFTLIKPWVQNLTPTSQDSSTGELFYSWITIAAH